MTINYILGDLLASGEQMIAHGCNSHGVQGSGVAKAIRDMYPDNYEVYHRVYEELGLYLGDVVYHYELPLQIDGLPTLIIANCVTQKDYGRDPNVVYVDYDAVFESLNQVFAAAATFKLSSVGLPMIGAGLANGDWDIIEGLVEQISNKYKVAANVYVIDEALYNKLVA